LICVYRTYSPNIDDVIKSEREDITKKTEKFRQVSRRYHNNPIIVHTCSAIISHTSSLQYIVDLSKKKMTFTLDRRITGSRIIDESLQVHTHNICKTILGDNTD